MFNIITVEQNFRDFSGFAFWLYLTNWQKQCWWIYSNTISILLVIGKTDGKESFRNLYSTSTKVGVFIKRTLHTPSDPPQKLNISSTTKTRRTTTTIKKKNNIINNNKLPTNADWRSTTTTTSAGASTTTRKTNGQQNNNNNAIDGDPKKQETTTTNANK